MRRGPCQLIRAYILSYLGEIQPARPADTISTAVQNGCLFRAVVDSSTSDIRSSVLNGRRRHRLFKAARGPFDACIENERASSSENSALDSFILSLYQQERFLNLFKSHSDASLLNSIKKKNTIYILLNLSLNKKRISQNVYTKCHRGYTKQTFLRGNFPTVRRIEWLSYVTRY